MLDHPKKHPTEITLTFIGPDAMKKQAIEFMQSIGFTGPFYSAVVFYSQEDQGTLRNHLT